MDKLIWYDNEGRIYCRRGYEIALARLASYEATGLMPEEIVKMGMAYEDSKRYSGRLELNLNDMEKRLPRWISVTERLPSEPDLVTGKYHSLIIVCDKDGDVGFTYWDCNLGMPNADVTHWMPLPEPPRKT